MKIIRCILIGLIIIAFHACNSENEDLPPDFIWLEGYGTAPDAPNGDISLAYCSDALSASQEDLWYTTAFADSLYLSMSDGITRYRFTFFACSDEINPRRSKLCTLPDTGPCPDYNMNRLFTFRYSEEYAGRCSMTWGPAALNPHRPSLTGRVCPTRKQ